MRFELIVPPFWTLLEAPPAGAAMLRGRLLADGVAVAVRDFNIELVHWLLDAEGRAALQSHCAAELHDLAGQALDVPQQLVHTRLAWGLAVLHDLGAATAACRAPAAVLRDPALLEHAEARPAARRRVARVMGLANYLLRSERRRARRFVALDDLVHGAGAPPGDPIAHWLHGRAAEVLTDGGAGRGPDAVGLSVTAPEQLPAALEIAHALRRLSPDTPIIVGGAAITRERALLQQSSAFFALFDAAVVFEGETALSKWLRAVAESGRRRNGWSAIPNLMYRDEDVGPPVATPLRSEDTTQLPAPDWSDVRWERYLAPARCAYWEASRGCYHGRCAYCADRFAHRGYRARRPEQVAAVLANLRAQHDVEAVLFTDESLHPDVARALCAAVAPDRSVPFWGGELRPEIDFDDTLLTAMRGAGCRRIQVGVESLSDPVLLSARRGVDADRAEAFLDRAAAADLPCEIFIVDGLPGETPAHRAETLDRLRALALPPGSWVACSPFYLDRRTPMARKPERWGLTIADPPPTGLDQHPVYRVEGDALPHAGDRALEAPLVVAPERWPDWPVEGHPALLWCTRHASAPDHARWSPPLSHHTPSAERGLRGAPLPPEWLTRDAQPNDIPALVSELVPVALDRDPLSAHAARRRVDHAYRESVLAGRGRDESMEAAVATEPPATPTGPQHYLLDLQRDQWLPVNATAAIFVAAMDGRATVAELAAAAAPRFGEPPPAVHAAALAVVTHLHRFGAITLRAAAPDAERA